MNIISWDVGIIHLAYCVLNYDIENDQIKIIDWDNINLLEDETKEIICCGDTKKGKCIKKAYYSLCNGKSSYGFCKTHSGQADQYYPKKAKESSNRTCQYVTSKGTSCDKKCKFLFAKLHLCNKHYKCKLEDVKLKVIKKKSSNKYPTSLLQIKLIKKLDSLIKKFSTYNIQEVIIENQPSKKNQRMKSISNTLFDYFLIRGYIDNSYESEIKLVKFICPSNKLKMNNDNTIEIFKANKNPGKKYKLTKDLSIQYTKKLLENDDDHLTFLNTFKKKDDLCDCYLQGLYYLKFIRK